jgi:hypothetical protein
VQEEGGTPTCYGDAAKVCPKDEDGFIQPQPTCLKCTWVRPCLQEALKTQGLWKEEPESTAEIQTPVGRFLRRWSERKRMAAGKAPSKETPHPR